MEIIQYRHQLINPNIKVVYWNNKKGVQTINIGTYWKPIARLLGRMCQQIGYRVHYRGRGRREGKHTNSNNDIRIGDSKFLAIYLHKKEVSHCNVKHNQG